MKKLIVMFLVMMIIFALAISAAGCSYTGECKYCHEIKRIKTHTYPSGVKVEICDDCFSFRQYLQ